MSNGETKWADGVLLGSEIKGQGTKQDGSQWTRYAAKFQVDNQTQTFTVFYPLTNPETLDFMSLQINKTYNIGYRQEQRVNKANQAYMAKTVFVIKDTQNQQQVTPQPPMQQPHQVPQAVATPTNLAPVPQNPSPQPHKPVDREADIRLGQALNLAIQILLAKDKPINQETVFDAVFKTTLPLITALKQERDNRLQGMKEAVKQSPMEQEKSDIYNFIKTMGEGEGVSMEALTHKFGEQVDNLIDSLVRNGDAFWVKAGYLKVLE